MIKKIPRKANERKNDINEICTEIEKLSNTKRSKKLPGEITCSLGGYIKTNERDIHNSKRKKKHCRGGMNT